MPQFIEIVPASQRMLPAPCPRCLWWQTTHGTRTGLRERVQWMARLEQQWGSVGMVAVKEGETVAAVQFAPASALPRSRCLPCGSPPSDAILLFCLRGRIGEPAQETRRLLHRSMAHLRHRRVNEVYAFARPLGSNALCGLRNLCGLEFLEANGFQVVCGGNDTFLMRADLRGLVPRIKEVQSALKKLRSPSPTPSPVAWSAPDL